MSRFGLALASLAGAWMITTAHADARSAAVPDRHSYAQPALFRVTHADLDLAVDFERSRLTGAVALTVERHDAQARELLLDSRDLTIHGVTVSTEGGRPDMAEFSVGERDAVLGSPIRIAMPGAAKGAKHVVRIEYETQPEASGLQWVSPAQTAGKQHPFLYTQSQAIHARSWVPLQDTPQVRFTYTARVRTPRPLLAVMSASNEVDTPRDGDYRFEMPQPIPSYLLALAVGDLSFRAIGERTGVYAEPATLDAAAHEFADVEDMLETCERLFGPYRWGRYDLLILPPSFPWGGMENPRLSFITPTVIAGDRSLVALIAHELAHSWSGNLVTNASWNDVWLNEGFTVYLERRIMEVLYGERRRAMEDVLGLQSLQRDIESLRGAGDAALTRLAVDLGGRDPDVGFSNVPYEKGRLFLGFLEARMGRPALDAFLREYFDAHAFQSVDTATFRDDLQAYMQRHPQHAVSAGDIDAWIHGEGLPANAVLPQSEAFAAVDRQAADWLAGGDTSVLGTGEWTTHEWLHFLDNLPEDLGAARMAELDAAFDLSEVGNNEIAHSWLRNVIRANYAPGYGRLEAYLTSIGRRKLVKPLYEELAKTPQGLERARAIYAKARPMYHGMLVAQLDELLAPAPAGDR